MSTVFEAFPESFNELRKQLATNHQDIWEKVSWAMVHRQEIFIEVMNHELSPFLVLPYGLEQSIDTCCKGWLRALERRPHTSTMSAIDTIHPMNVDKLHVVKPTHKPVVTPSMFDAYETANMSDKQLDEAAKLGYHAKH
jgi:hypothetical protein